MIKKRYIYSSLLASIFFIILYLLLDFNLIITLIFTVIVYFAGIFLYKEKDIRKYNPDYIMHYCYLISKINNYISNIEDKDVKQSLILLSENSEKIINMLEQKPNKVTQVYDGFDYYLPLTLKVVKQYMEVTEKKSLNSSEKKFLDDMSKCLKNIDIEIKKLLNNMNYTKMLDINSDIKLFKNDNDSVNSELEKRSIENEEGR